MGYGLMVLVGATAIGAVEAALLVRLMRFQFIGAAITDAAAMSGCGLVLMILTWVSLQLG
jgi:hypothetical protein